MAKEMLSVSEGTQIKITFSALLFILAGVVGFATWMTSMQLGLTANAASIESLSTDKEDTKNIIIRIDKSVTAIKTYLRIKEPKGYDE